MLGIITKCLIFDPTTWIEPDTIQKHLKDKFGAEIVSLQNMSSRKTRYWKDRIEKEEKVEKKRRKKKETEEIRCMRKSLVKKRVKKK